MNRIRKRLIVGQRSAFPMLPTWGACIRHAKSIESRNSKMITRRPDKRKEIVVVGG